MHVDGVGVPGGGAGTSALVHAPFVGATALVRFAFDVADALLDVGRTATAESGPDEDADAEQAKHEPEHDVSLPPRGHDLHGRHVHGVRFAAWMS